MSDSVKKFVPDGATHVLQSYGTIYYAQIIQDHYNTISDRRQILVKWKFWDSNLKQWVNEGSGFSSRNLKKLSEGETK